LTGVKDAHGRLRKARRSGNFTASDIPARFGFSESAGTGAGGAMPPEPAELEPESEEELAALERAMAETPRGAVALAGAAVVLLMICWLAIYLFVFLPRGTVG
jgi:hypothetical protein